ncbi:hypothetical protein [Streptomyces sp. NPDC046805]|uniref:hypothetical protein n=1 Tax=Streptomyces sp. NPDC046805 TaxID=3155134 RepID=UPI0033C50EB6
MMSSAKIGAAVVGGYVLGRRKKAKIAIGLGLLLAGAGARPRQLAKTLTESPIVGTVNERLRGELSGVGKAAATAVLTSQAEKIADAIHDRTEELRLPESEDKSPVKTEPPDEEAEDIEPEDEEPDDSASDEKPSGARASQARKPASRSTTRARKTARSRPRAKAPASGTGKRSADDG